MGWLVLSIYALGYVLTWRTAVWGAIESMAWGKQPTGAEVAFGVFAGSLLTVFWPLFWIYKFVQKLYLAREQGVLRFLMPRAIRREQELKERQERIAALEYELRIGPRRSEASSGRSSSRRR